MSKCKYCQAELAENGDFCPVCGKNNSEQEIQEEAVVLEETASAEETVSVEQETPATAELAAEEKPKASPAKIAMAVVAVVVLAAVLIALLVGGLGGVADTEETIAETMEAVEEPIVATIPPDGNPDDETCKGTYTASDEEVIANADTVVATVGDFQLTNAELQVYYWMEIRSFLDSSYGTYATYYFGLDLSQPLDTQVCGLTGSGTWQQFFLANALGSWQNYQSMAAEADLTGFELSAEDQEYLNNLAQSMEEDAVTYGFADADALLAYHVGNGAEIEDYVNHMNVYVKGIQYYNELYNQIEITEEEIEEYYLANEAAYTESGINQDDKYVDVRHILIIPEGGTTDENGITTYSDEEWAACQAEAQAILDEWLAGEKTEESFAELANTYTQDGNDANYDGVPDGGLYTDVYVGQMVEPFENWCFDESRVTGDTGLVQTTYGWHVMYFVDSTPVWKVYTESDLLAERSNAIVSEIASKYPLVVDYSSILLGYVDLSV